MAAIDVMELKAGNERTSSSNNWRGGKLINSRGYYEVYCPEHPHAMCNGKIREHRLVMERHLGRYLKPEERIHHINGNKLDNRIENLVLFKNEQEHQSGVPHRKGVFVYKGRIKEYKKEWHLKNRWRTIPRMRERYRRIKSNLETIGD